MFDNLSGRLNSIFKHLKGYGRLSEKNIQEGLREVRLALLEADVNYKVVKDFIARVKERAVGQEVMESLNLAGRQPAVILLVGLQGSGKTTTAAKLARWLRSKGRRPYLVPADTYRPAAIEQLHILGNQLKIDVHPSNTTTSPVDIVKQAVAKADAVELLVRLGYVRHRACRQLRHLFLLHVAVDAESQQGRDQ